MKYFWQKNKNSHTILKVGNNLMYKYDYSLIKNEDIFIKIPLLSHQKY